MSIIIHQVSYIHPDREVLFRNISFSVSGGQKIALIGNNGSGKSTLLQIIAGVLSPSEGEVTSSDKPYYVPQHFGQYGDTTVAQALKIDHKINALHAILNGDVSPGHFTHLDDDWNIEERSLAGLSYWGLSGISLQQEMKYLSGGEKTKVFLSGMLIHSPDVILLDEPTNHLDVNGRQLLYHYIQGSNATIIVVSHDRTLLNLLNMTLELSRNGIEAYGGNYEFYKIQKEEQLNALQSQLGEKEKELRHMRQVSRSAMERKQKQDVRGKKQSAEKGIPRIMMKSLKNSAEESTSKLKEVHQERMEGISGDLEQIRQKLPEVKELKMGIEESRLHTGKILVKAEKINFGYSSQLLWKTPLNFQVKSGDRFVISGTNGSGKTTLLRLILGELTPTEGDLFRAGFRYLYLDQEYSVINPELTVFEQVQEFNVRNLLEHELKTELHRFLFPASTWDKPCENLSGGEKIRLIFCCLEISNNKPDLFALDEPTNNLDIQSLNLITAAIRQYKGTVILISHDSYFINEINIDQKIQLDT